MNKKLTMKSSRQLFITILLPFLFCIMLTILILSSVLYSSFEKLALNLVYDQKLSDLKDISRNISTMQQTVNALSTQAFFDSTLGDLLYYPQVDPADLSKYMMKLQSYKNIYPFLYSIYIYNGQKIYAAPSISFINDIGTFGDKEVFSILHNMKDYKSYSIIPRKIPNILYQVAADDKKWTYVYSYLFYESQHQDGQISEAIIMNISEEWLTKSILSFGKNDGSRVFIVDKSGKLISHDSGIEIFSDISKTSYIQQINVTNKPQGYIRTKIDGRDTFVTYAKADVFDWQLISITPYEHIVKDIDNMRSNTYTVVLFMLIIGVATAVFLSRRIYIPVQSVIQHLNALESEKKNEFYIRKQQFLKNLLLKDFTYDFDLLVALLQNNNITLDSKQRFIMMLAKIDHYADFCDLYNASDRNLMKFGIMNIMTEILSTHYQTESVDMDNDHIVVLIRYPDAQLPSENALLLSIVSDLSVNVEKHLQISLSFTLSEAFDGMDLLNDRYLETLEFSSDRVIFGRKSVIFSKNLRLPSEEYKYPVDKAKILCEEISLGHIDQTKQHFTEILDNASRYGYTVLSATIMRLLLSIHNTIDAINASTGLHFNFNYNVFLSRLQRFETIQEIQAAFFDVFDSFVTEITQKKEQKHEKLLDAAMTIISGDYTNPNLSLESIAELVNLSPSYLGRLFKKRYMMSVSDYINHLRLEKTKTMLASSDETLVNIMSLSGFLSRSHFFTLFKKVHGLTPNEYRSNAKTEAPD